MGERPTQSGDVVNELARELHRQRWPDGVWFGDNTNRSYWRREARKQLGDKPKETP